MCLNVHSAQKKVIIADRDYLVYKLLRRVVGYPSYNPNVPAFGYSAFRSFCYQFGKQVTERRIKDKLPRKPAWWGRGRAYQASLRVGLHSMRAKVCEGQWAYLRNAVKSGSRKFFPAVIPKGSKLWYGDSGDVISDQLIVFRDMAHLEEYYDAVSSVS